MGQTNSKRVSHDNANLPTLYRDDQVEQILNDLSEEDSGKGYSEVYYVGATPFVDKIIVWQDVGLTIKRTETQFSYSPTPFVSQIQKKFYADDGIAIIGTITATVTYNVNKTVQKVSVVNTRP